MRHHPRDAAFRRHEEFGGDPRGRRHGYERGRHGGGRREEGPAPVATDAIGAWLTGRLPADWFTGPAEVSIDRDEIVVIGTLAPPEVPADADAATVGEAEAGRISRFREETREARMGIAREAEQRYERRVAWGASAGSTSQLFTAASVPVMTRLRQPERQVLDTLVDAGVARSRSDALAWCVRLVGRNTDEWLARLREAMTSVEAVRAEGPPA